MEKCKKCGEMVDYNNPAIHYGGHVCKPKSVAPSEAELQRQKSEIRPKYEPLSPVGKYDLTTRIVMGMHKAAVINTELGVVMPTAEVIRLIEIGEAVVKAFEEDEDGVQFIRKIPSIEKLLEWAKGRESE